LHLTSVFQAFTALTFLKVTFTVLSVIYVVDDKANESENFFSRKIQYNILFCRMTHLVWRVFGTKELTRPTAELIFIKLLVTLNTFCY